MHQQQSNEATYNAVNTESLKSSRIAPVNTVPHGQIESFSGKGGAQSKLQALLYDILPSTTAVFSYTIGSRKLSANEQFLLVLRQ